MLKRRNVITVEVNLDDIPGWNYDPDDMVKMLQYELDRAVPHYKPVVRQHRVYQYDPLADAYP